MPVSAADHSETLLAAPDGWPGVSRDADELAVVTRSGFVESRHLGHAAVVAADGTLVRGVGDPDTTCFPRSSLKPLQAAALLLAGAPLDGERLAVATASHRGEPYHLELVAAMLSDAGQSPDDLQCPPELPAGEQARTEVLRAGGAPTRLTMNCSGKHAGMLAACLAAGWDPAGYLDEAHPLQVLVRRVVELATGVGVDHVGVDGCGAPVFTTTIRGLATAIGRVGRMADSPDREVPVGADREVDLAEVEAALGRVGRAMRAHPRAVAGTGADDTVVMDHLDGVVAKGGAEGVMALGTADGHGIAVKVLDGAHRPAMVAALALASATGIDTRSVADTVAPRQLGHGQPVGRVHAAASLALPPGSPTFGQADAAARP